MTGKKLGRRSAAPVQSTELDLTSWKSPRQEVFFTRGERGDQGCIYTRPQSG